MISRIVIANKLACSELIGVLTFCRFVDPSSVRSQSRRAVIALQRSAVLCFGTCCCRYPAIVLPRSNAIKTSTVISFFRLMANVFWILHFC